MENFDPKPTDIKAFGPCTQVVISKLSDVLCPTFQQFFPNDLDKVVLHIDTYVCSVNIDLKDVIRWIKENHPELL